MIKQKKSQIFTLVAIALLILFFTTYEIYSTLHERTAIKSRIKTMQSFIFSIEKDLERQFYISGFRIIFLAENQIARTGSYIQSFNSFFEEAVFNGTVSQEQTDVMNGATINDIINSIQAKAEKMNLEINFSEIDVSVGQDNPWDVVVYFNAILNLTDKSNLARWYKNETIKAHVSIEGFEDPLYLLNTYGKVSRKIYKTPYEGNYARFGDKTNFSLHLENKYYANNSDAPSFLNRLQGDNVANSNGIESFVYIPELTAQGISVQEKSVADHIYFSSENPSATYFPDLPSWFRIDSAHKTRYQLN